jgi:hypothetical protein
MTSTPSKQWVSSRYGNNPFETQNRCTHLRIFNIILRDDRYLPSNNRVYISIKRHVINSVLTFRGSKEELLLQEQPIEPTKGYW